MKYKYIECWIGGSNRYSAGEVTMPPQQFLSAQQTHVDIIIFRIHQGRIEALIDNSWQQGCPPSNVFYSIELDSDYAELLETYID